MGACGLRRVVAVIVGACAGALTATASCAEFPYPANPRPCAAAGAPAGCIAPTDFHRYLFLPATEPPTRPDDFDDSWKLTSDPTGEAAIDQNPQELFGVKGASVDRAWQVTTGRPDVVLAVLDSGIRWGEPQPDLVNKFYLNRGELPPPEGSTNVADPHDRNGDGVFNVQDYLAGGGFAQDSRISDLNGNGVIDPEDLIFRFSDGIDDDHNGYVDDISGWDFFEDDNDALDEVRYGHGTGESHDSGAEANNGIEGPGACPNCMVLEVRVGDAFVTDVNKFAQGVVFAVDSGARVVQEALGTLNNSAFAQQAIDYAYGHGLVVMASAADEESAHDNYPANYNHTVEVNSVTKFFDAGGVTQTPHSYLYLNGCTNYNGHIAVSVPSSSCSSEATGLSAGMAGLLYSAALNAVANGSLAPYPGGSMPLSAEEVRQLLIATADDVNFDARPDLDPPRPQNYGTDVPLPGVTQTSSRFPSIAGFDQYFGYGRVNADAAVRRVRDGRIPPEAAITAPPWHAYLSPQVGTIDLVGHVAARRAHSFHYVVAVAPGVQQAEGTFVEVARSDERTTDVDGVLARLDLAHVAALLPHGTTGAPVVDDGSGRGDPDRFAFTVRVRVTDDRGEQGEDRRTLHLHDDPELVPGFPIFLGTDGASSPVPADLDQDGVEELLVATSNGQVHALHVDGTELPGWPVATRPLAIHAASAGFASGTVPVPHGAILGEVAVGDLDRDGSLDVVAADAEGYVYVWGADGGLRPGFPVSTLAAYSNARRSERDLTTDAGRNPDKTNRHSPDNRLARGFGAGPALGNLDGSADGSLEIVVGANDRHVYAWDRHGGPVPGWPVLLKDPAKVERVDPETDEVTMKADASARQGTKIIRSASLGDLDGDGTLDVVAVVNEEYGERPNATFDDLTLNFFIKAGLLNPGNTRVYALHHDGTAHGASPLVRGWNPDAFMAGWPVKTALLTTELLPVVGTGSNGAAALGDLDGDGRLEVVTFSAIGPVYIFRADGTSALGLDNRRLPVVLAQEPFAAGSNTVDAPTFGSLGAPAIAELRGPGTGYNVIAPAVGLGKSIDAQLPAQQRPADSMIGAWGLDRRLLPTFPRQVNDLQFFVTPVVADISGDGVPEILEGSGVRELHAVDAEGAEPPGWPKFTAGWSVTAPAVTDLDGDGRLEVAHVTREGWLFVWKTPGDACGNRPWRHARHDAWGTSNIHTDATPPARLGAVTLTSTASDTVVFRTGTLPGDDLYCGAKAALDVRFAAAPVRDAADFDAATPAQSVTGQEPLLVVYDPRFGGQTLYLAAVARDAAGNRSAVSDLGRVTFPAAPTPTTTATPVPASTVTPTVSPTAAVPTATPPTRRGGHDGDGCMVGPGRRPGGLAGAWLVVPFALRRRRGRTSHRRTLRRPAGRRITASPAPPTR